jgi:hypothetical protein
MRGPMVTPPPGAPSVAPQVVFLRSAIFTSGLSDHEVPVHSRQAKAAHLSEKEIRTATLVKHASVLGVEAA